MNYLSHVVTTKGVVHSVERSAQILRRFLMGRRRFLQMVSSLEKDLNGSAKITFCVTACLLAENAVLFRRLRQIGHDVAAHGYIHTNMKNKTRKEQIEIIGKCSNIFEQFRMPITGFRCPYLSYNKDTLDVLQRGGFSWTSNNMILWSNGLNGGGNDHGRRSLKKISDLYHIESGDQTAALPRFKNKCLDIPITGPDDEMLLERLRIRKREKIVEIWMNVLEKTHDRGELFHLLFHPERFDQVGGCIREIIDRLGRFDRPVWVASLREITEWWRHRAGLSWEHERLCDGSFRTWVSLPSRATMLMKQQDSGLNGQKSFFGNYMPAPPAEYRNGKTAFPCYKGKKSTIGLSRDCSADAETFLREEGFMAERSSNPEEHAIYVRGYENFSRADELRLLAEIEGSPFPALRIWRWPDGMQSAFTISADVDSVTLMDFVRRALQF